MYTRKILTTIILFSVALLVNILIKSFFPSRSIHLISTSTIFLILLFLLISSFVRKKLNIIHIRIWYFFYFAGILFLNGAALLDSKLKIKNENADNFYFLCLICLSLGYIISELIYPERRMYVALNKYSYIDRVFVIFILLFPFFFFISTFLSLGFVPMLTGESIVDDMYNYNYGVLYGYKFILIFSILLSIYYSIIKNTKWPFILLFIIFAMISLIDGKRAVLLNSSISGIILYYLYSEKYGKVNTKIMIIMFSLVALMYTSLGTLRGARENELINVSSIVQKFPFGVEYTDYVYSFESYDPGSIRNYDFLGSAVGSFFNTNILNLFGLDKKSMVTSGSAYAWMKLYGIDMGIRTGIISELYFAYGYWTFLIVFLMAFYFDYINRKIFNSNNLLLFIIFLCVYGLNVLLIVGQATVYFGTLTLILYLYLFYKVLMLFRKYNIS